MPDLYQILDELAIPYEKFEHEPFYTCEDAEALYSKLDGGHSKNLFLRNASGKQHYLVIVDYKKRVDLKALGQSLGEKLGFASEERLFKYLGVTPGSVSPFGLIHDADHHVKVLLDADLLQHDWLHYHPLVNTATLRIARADLLKFLEWRGSEVLFFSHLA